jgi:hypothetical protein
MCYSFHAFDAACLYAVIAWHANMLFMGTDACSCRRLPYPSGSASGYMIQSLHMQGGSEAAAAAVKVKLLGWTAAGSFVFDAFKW